LYSTHINALLGSAFRESLRAVRCLHASLRNQTVIDLAEQCPDLEDVAFEGARSLGDAALAALIENCLEIRAISISGDDRSPGGVKAKGLEEVFSDPECGQELRYLWLVDQHLHDKSVKRFSKMRPNMAIITGSTEGDSNAARIVASMTGGAYFEVMMDGRLAQSDDGYGGMMGYY
jgi:hypothetical protein